jgi:hypothetical protein
MTLKPTLKKRKNISTKVYWCFKVTNPLRYEQKRKLAHTLLEFDVSYLLRSIEARHPLSGDLESEPLCRCESKGRVEEERHFDLKSCVLGTRERKKNKIC